MGRALLRSTTVDRSCNPPDFRSHARYPRRMEAEDPKPSLGRRLRAAGRPSIGLAFTAVGVIIALIAHRRGGGARGRGTVTTARPPANPRPGRGMPHCGQALHRAPQRAGHGGLHGPASDLRHRAGHGHAELADGSGEVTVTATASRAPPSPLGPRCPRRRRPPRRRGGAGERARSGNARRGGRQGARGRARAGAAQWPSAVPGRGRRRRRRSWPPPVPARRRSAGRRSGWTGPPRSAPPSWRPRPSGRPTAAHRRRRDGGPRGPGPALGDQQLEQRLLGVQAVLGLVPDGRALAVEHSSVISSPGCAGRQCSTTASSRACASSSPSSR